MITKPEINSYSEQYSTKELSLLKRLREETIQTVHGANMISGHIQGLFIQMVSKMLNPKSVLEIGTYTGYSAICLAQGLQEGGVVHTIDIDNKLQAIRDKYWTQARLQHKIVQHIGDAVQIIPDLTGTFDLVFIDADKKGYSFYYDLIIDRLPMGAHILADNTLFHAEVILPSEKMSKAAKYIHEFNQKVELDKRVETVLLPIRDGLTLIRKK